ncbi:hypothetical protein [Salipiger abyssi]|uniref:hypothetical protein n=1 Tax=Salipiger abyssi TaxID=1250539 RepID=UPI00405A3A83
MTSKSLFSACLLGIYPLACFADPTVDAKFIAEQHFEYSGYIQSLEVLEKGTFDSLSSSTKNLGATIINPELFVHELTGELTDTLPSRIVDASAEAYVKILTPRELSELATFYRSSEGRELLSGSPKTIADFEVSSFFLNGPGSPILEHYPEMLANMDQIIAQSLSIISSSFTMDRIAEIFENPKIIGFEDERTRAKVVAGIRSAD